MKHPSQKAVHVDLPAKQAHWLREEAARRKKTQRRLLAEILAAAEAGENAYRLMIPHALLDVIAAGSDEGAKWVVDFAGSASALESLDELVQYGGFRTRQEALEWLFGMLLVDLRILKKVGWLA